MSERQSLQPLFISEHRVVELLTWDKTFDAVELSMKKVAQKRVSQSPRTFTSVADKGVLGCMPGYLEDDEYGALGCKLFTHFTNKPPLPTTLANILLFDDTTGVLKAVVGGTEITSWRTAAASAVATKYIHEKNKPCRILAIMGAGAQGRIHAEMFRHFFKFEEIRIWNRTTERARQLANELNMKYNTSVFVYFDNNEVCVRDADVIVTATNANNTILKYDWIKNGAHVNAVGVGRNPRELEEKIYHQADIFIDYWDGAKRELADLEKLGVKFKGEVGGVITGDVPLSPLERITVFQSLGMAVEDCAVARVVYDLHMKQKI